LMDEFFDEPQRHASGRYQIAVVTDVRAAGFAEDFPSLLDRLDSNLETALVFVEASDEVLLRRFSETRRPHPLAKGTSLLEAIRAERRLLAELRARADLIIDTSETSVHDLRRQIYREFASAFEREPELVVSLVSFGHKHGIPRAADLLFDVRFLANPHFVQELRSQTGRDEPVRLFLEEEDEYGELAERIESYLLHVLPKYQRENRSYLSIGVGCTGGHHRSVAMAERLAKRLGAQGWTVQLNHRDIEK
ncbi:MAG: RNase adapter RapZ, partial [Acidobacteriota bacterium]|nr:RNase adapter RapZ [Acidobacteriota bacterium]